MKRIVLSFLLLLLLGNLPVLAEEPQEGTITLLSELEIMEGDPDGNLRLNDPVTRAEFTKMAVAGSSFRNSVAKGLSISPFPDVTYRHWAAPYVRVGVTNGLISGYPDATFRPDDGVLLEEGITIMLRVLGYTDQDFGLSWPSGQLGLAQNLDMTDNLDCSAGEIMNRGQVAQLICNSLSIKQKDTAMQLANTFDVQILEDVSLIADHTGDSSIAVDEIFTTNGIYRVDSSFDHSLLGLSGDVAIKNGNKLLAFFPDSEISTTEDYVVYSTLSSTVMAYKDDALQSVEIDDNTIVYKGKTQTTFELLKPTLKLGDLLHIKRTESSIDYITWQKGSLQGPLTISSGNPKEIWGVTEDTTVMRDGISISLSSLQPYDIAYYLKDVDMILAYSDKVTGIFEKATPNKDTPTTITLSGKDYSVEGGDAFRKLSSGGDFLYGDTLTLLLGKDGGIADVISSTSVEEGPVVGYVIETGRKDYQSGVTNNYSGYYVTLALINGDIVEYTTQKDYQSSVNKVVKVRFENGNATLSSASSSNQNLKGTFSWKNRIFGSYPLSSSLSILDIGSTKEADPPSYACIFPQRLENVQIPHDSVLYYELNEQGAVQKLILDNVTNDSFSFGLTTHASNNSKSLTGSYQYLINGQLYSLSTKNRILNIDSGQGIMIKGSPANPSSVHTLMELSGKITQLSSGYLVISDTSLPLNSSVAVYEKHSLYDNNYTKIPLSNILNRDSLSCSVYYDKLPSEGGQVRIIVVYD